MSDAFTNLGRGAFGVVGFVVYWFWRRQRWSAPWFWPAWWAATRLGAMVVLFAVLRLPAPTDASSTYIVQARGAAAGLVPYRDFESSFAPLYPFVLAAFTAVWNSAYVFVVASVLLEGAMLFAWQRWGPRLAGSEVVRDAAAAYLCSALPFNTAIMGQDEIGVALLVTALVMLLHAQRPWTSAVLTGVTLAVTKFTSLLYVPFLAWRSGRLLRFTALALAVAAPAYVLTVLRSGDILAPLKFESGLFTNGNVIFLASLAGGEWIRSVMFGRIALAALMGVLGLLFLHYWRRRRPGTDDLIEALVVAELVFLLLFKKSYHIYLAMVFPLLCLLLAQRDLRWLPRLLVLTTLSVIQQSLFFRVMHQHDLSTWTLATSTWAQKIFVVFDAVTVAGYAWLTVSLLRQRMPTESGVPA